MTIEQAGNIVSEQTDKMLASKILVGSEYYVKISTVSELIEAIRMLDKAHGEELNRIIYKPLN